MMSATPVLPIVSWSVAHRSSFVVLSYQPINKEKCSGTIIVAL
jgi:hypothetical protein